MPDEKPGAKPHSTQDVDAVIAQFDERWLEHLRAPPTAEDLAMSSALEGSDPHPGQGEDSHLDPLPEPKHDAMRTWANTRVPPR